MSEAPAEFIGVSRSNPTQPKIAKGSAVTTQASRKTPNARRSSADHAPIWSMRSHHHFDHMRDPRGTFLYPRKKPLPPTSQKQVPFECTRYLYPHRVNNGPDRAETGLPKCPTEQTFTVLVGMSRTCQCRKYRTRHKASSRALAVNSRSRSLCRTERARCPDDLVSVADAF
jgi:hypothetical protein